MHLVILSAEHAHASRHLDSVLRRPLSGSRTDRSTKTLTPQANQKASAGSHRLRSASCLRSGRWKSQSPSIRSAADATAGNGQQKLEPTARNRHRGGLAVYGHPSQPPYANTLIENPLAKGPSACNPASPLPSLASPIPRDLCWIQSRAGSSLRSLPRPLSPRAPTYRFLFPSRPYPSRCRTSP